MKKWKILLIWDKILEPLFARQIYPPKKAFSKKGLGLISELEELGSPKTRSEHMRLYFPHINYSDILHQQHL